MNAADQSIGINAAMIEAIEPLAACLSEYQVQSEAMRKSVRAFARAIARTIARRAVSHFLALPQFRPGPSRPRSQRRRRKIVIAKQRHCRFLKSLGGALPGEIA